MQKKDFLHSDFIPFDAVLDIMCLLNMAILRHCYITSLLELLNKQFQIVLEPATCCPKKVKLVVLNESGYKLTEKG